MSDESGKAARPRPAETPRYWLDASRWPLLVVVLPPSPKDDEVGAYLKHLGTYRQRRQPYVLMVDATHALSFSSTQRKMQADHIREGLPITRLYLKGIAYVAQSAVKRGVVTALHWLVKPPAPHQVFATKEEAEVWLMGQLEG